MCVYSAYVDSATKQWPGLGEPWPNPFNPPKQMPNFWPPQAPMDPKILQEILDIGKRLDRIDKALGLKDCTQEDAAKRKFEARLEKLIKDANDLHQYASSNEPKSHGIATTGFANATGFAAPAGAISGAQYVIGNQPSYTHPTGIALGGGQSTNQQAINRA